MKSINIKDIIIGQGTPKICVPLVAKNEEDILQKAEEIAVKAKEQGVDIVEFRGDFYKNLGDFEKLKALLLKLKDIFSDIVFLFTIRSFSEGGEKLAFETPSIEDINTFVIENRLADIVDVEYMSGDKSRDTLTALAKEKGIKIIMSYHNFKATPEVDFMVNRLKAMVEAGADIAKIAVMPKDSRDVANLLEATATAKTSLGEVPLVTISMGRLGLISRISGEVFGSAITFATMGESSAPGQIPAADVKEFLSKLSMEVE